MHSEKLTVRCVLRPNSVYVHVTLIMNPSEELIIIKSWTLSYIRSEAQQFPKIAVFEQVGAPHHI